MFLKDNNVNNEDKLMDLFDIIYDNEIKYFQLIKKIVLNYKQKGKKIFKQKFLLLHKFIFSNIF